MTSKSIVCQKYNRFVEACKTRQMSISAVNGKKHFGFEKIANHCYSCGFTMATAVAMALIKRLIVANQ